MEFINTEIAGNSLLNWLIAGCISIAVLLVAGVVRFVLSRQLGKLAARHDVTVWHVLQTMVRKTRWLFLFIVALVTGAVVLSVPDKMRSLLSLALIVALLIQAGLWAGAALQVFMDQYRKRQLAKDPASVTTLSVVNFIGSIIIWSFVLMMVLDNMGVNITALVAGLGVGGIAVALALQAILGDLFASLSIVLDKPFVVGDFLNVGEMLGTVEYVGLKTTRLRSLSGEQLIFSNADLLNSRIRNYGRMYERRVPFEIGVTYQTPRDKIKLIPQIIREGIEKQDKTRFDRSNFKAYGDFALIFETVYFVKGPDYNQYMNIHEAVLLHIHERFEAEGIEFAFPTQLVYVKQS